MLPLVTLSILSQNPSVSTGLSQASQRPELIRKCGTAAVLNKVAASWCPISTKRTEALEC
jgi:hypothetical protein